MANPVLERELRERVRTRGGLVVLTLYLLALVALFYLVHRVYVETASPSFMGRPAVPRPTDAARIGRGVFEWLLAIMLAFVLFIVPGYTAGAVAGERERQTLIPMQLTLLRPRQIATGKVTASMAFLLLLLVASAPVLAVAFVIGGVSAAEALRGLAGIVYVGLGLACVSVMCSAVVRRVQVATVLAYALTLLLVIGPPVVWGGAYAAMNLNRPPSGPNMPSPTPEVPPVALLALQPALLAGAVLEGPDLDDPVDRNSALAQSASPFALTRSVLRSSGGGPRPSVNQRFANFLPMTILAWAAMAVGALVVASRRLRIPAEIER